MRVGIGISEDLHLDRQQRLAAAVEDAGFASLWTNEAQGRDALLTCQAWGAVTEDLMVGVGVIPLWTRSPAQLAMGAATLQESTGGRFVLGVGVSHPATMNTWHGAQYDRPLTAAKETLAILDQVFAGETTDVEGDIRSSRRFRLQIDPLPSRPRVLLAAMGPKMLETAGERADGTLLNWAGPDEVNRASDAVRNAADGEVEVAAYVRVAVSDDRDAARGALARELGNYCALPAYAVHLERQGFGDAVEAVKTAYKEEGPEAIPGAVDDDVLLQLGWYGTPDDDPVETLRAYAGAGLDHLVARVVVVGDDVERSVAAVLAALPPSM